MKGWLEVKNDDGTRFLVKADMVYALIEDEDGGTRIEVFLGDETDYEDTDEPYQFVKEKLMEALDEN